ncbi:uncharacterized protein [Acropora muricata]|uniref:uncharacterized protein n=1 Tax=Acropora muricata TaxID=159855 RepID=UPI0034E4BCED
MPGLVRDRMKQDRLRRETQEKYEHSPFTPKGVNITRLRPSINNTTILKYQNRPSSTALLSRHPSRSTSTPYVPVPSTQRTNSDLKTKGTGTQLTRSIGTQTRLNDVTCASPVKDKRTSVPHRTDSSLSNHSVTFTSRSASCQPKSLYENEHLQRVTRSSSKASDEERVRRRSVSGTKSPVRMDGTPVELPGFMKTNYFLNHEDLGLGQKQYIWGVARIYSVTQLMSLKQRQYQNLLDYEFSRRIQNKELKEHERVKEWKDYQRYCKFIKRYEQRIPSTKSKQASSPCEEASHVHRHFIKGWTTDPNANESYRSLKRRESSDTPQPQLTPEYHPIEEHDTFEMDSTGGNDEECRTSLIVLPSYSENSGSDGVTELEAKGKIVETPTNKEENFL